MKVLIFVNHGIGIYQQRKELLERLIADGHCVTVCVPEGEFSGELRAMGCRLIDVKLQRHGKNPMQDLGVLKRYKAVLKAEKPDIVLTYTIKPNIYGGIACARGNVPYVANITGLGTAVENQGVLQKITVMLYRYGLRKAQTVFFQNTENEEFFAKRRIAMGKHRMLPGSGVNLSFYKMLPFPEGDTVEFVFIARIMQEKGIDQYLDAAKYIRKKYPYTRFHVCGFCEQHYEKTIQELHRQGVIIYHGMVKDMRKIYETVQCTVHPTYYPEGLSNVLLESAASGRAIITTDRAGCREVIEDGVNGFLVKKQDSADCIEKIERFLSLSLEQRRQMGRNGRKKVEREFDRRIVIDRYLEELQKAAESGKR